MESTNKNVRFVLQVPDVDVFIFSPKDCIWNNFLMGEHNGIPEWCIIIYNPVGKDIELFVKEGEVIVIETFVDFNGHIVAKTAVSLSWKVACNVIYGYDELREENVSLESCFITEDEDIEPSVAELKYIEENELEELMYKSQHLTIEDLLEDEDN